MRETRARTERAAGSSNSDKPTVRPGAPERPTEELDDFTLEELLPLSRPEAPRGPESKRPKVFAPPIPREEPE
ncbi:MAG: hypothetical protein HOV80_05460 [Polyangiaceae bacterium]|nr:hypothetical protein [Polyangiaceae bacterium]